MEEEDAISRGSMESAVGEEAVREEVDGRKEAEEGNREEVKLGSHSDVGYSSMTEVQTVGEEPEQEERLEENKAGEKRELERQRSYSIVKPAVEEIETEKDDTEQPVVNRDNKDEQTTPG